MKEGKNYAIVFGVVFLFLVLSLSFTSANIFSDFWNKFTGKVIDAPGITGNAVSTSSISGWTQWYNRDGPGGSGDWELLSNLGDICGGQNITDVQCQTTDGIPSSQTGQVVTCTKSDGFYCQNSQNPSGCLDYEVRFYCGENSTTVSSYIFPSPFVENGNLDLAIIYGTAEGSSSLELLQAGNIQTTINSYLSEAHSDVLFKDNELSSVSNKNLILVGTGDVCSNSAISKVLGDNCSSTSPSLGIVKGKYLIETVKNPFSSSNKIALIVLGGSASDLVDATTYLLKTKNLNVSVGFKYLGTSSTETSSSTCSTDSVTGVITCTLYENDSLVLSNGLISKINSFYSSNPTLGLYKTPDSLEKSNPFYYLYLYPDSASYFGRITFNLINSSESQGFVKFNYSQAPEYSGTCENSINLMDKILNGDYNSEISPSWSYNYNSWTYLDGKSENYTESNIGFSLDRYNDYAYYSVYAYSFQNKDVNLSSFLHQLSSYQMCSISNYYSSNGTPNYFYICKSPYDVKNAKDSSASSYAVSDIFWYKGNVLMNMRVSHTKYPISSWEKDSAMGAIEVINSLKDNKYNYIDLSLDYGTPGIYEILSSFFDGCNSQIESNFSNNPSWACSLEPAICPPHGYQTQRCVDSNGIESPKETQISCNPGLCSGCMVPKFVSSSYWSQTERKCMPYGARFALQQTEGTQKVYEFNDNGTSTDASSLIVLDSDRAHLYIQQNNETLFDQDLYNGGTYDFNLYGQKLQFSVKEIYFESAGSSSNYVSLELLNNFDAYCDYDGQVKQQKIRDYKGDWASCQNNFECESNICSSGQCVNVNSVAEQAGSLKSLLVSVLCRIGSFFGGQNYDQCVLLNGGSSGNSISQVNATVNSSA